MVAIPLYPDPAPDSAIGLLLARLPGATRTRADEWEAPCPCSHDTDGAVSGILTLEHGLPEWFCGRECGTGTLWITLYPERAEAAAETVPSAWGFVSAAALLSEDIPDTRWLYRQLIPADSVTVVFSAPNAGKTFFGYHVISEIAAGAARAGYTVAILQYEGTRKALQTRLRRALRAAGADPARVAVSHNPPHLITDVEAAGWLAKECHGVDLILIDSLAAAVGDELDENDGVAQGKASASLKVIQMAAESAVAALSHMTKAAWAVGEKPTLASLRGHSKLHGRIDTALALVAGVSDASAVRFEIHSVKQRDAEHGKPLRYEVSMMGEEASVTVEEIDTGDKAERKSDALLLTILDFIRDQGEVGASANYCEKNVRGKGTRIREALTALHASGLIEIFQYRGYDRYRFVHGKGTTRDEMGRASGRTSSSPSPFMGTRDEPPGWVRPGCRPGESERKE